FCVSDARAIAALFQNHAARAFRRVVIRELHDEQATKSNLLEMLAELARQIKPQDTLVLYAACHGIGVGQRYYLIPSDFKLQSKDLEAEVRLKGFAIDELGDALGQAPALKRVLIFDTCHSGQVIGLAGKQHNPFAFRGAVERLNRAQGVYCLSAT